MKKRKILIHTLVFSPDGVSTAYLYNDVALGFKQNNYDVVVLTTTPHYNIIQKELEKQPLIKHWSKLFFTSNYHGIKVYHVPQKKFKNVAARILGFIYWHTISFLIGIGQRNVSLILSPSPPLTIGLVSILLGFVKRAKVIYNVQEIYPDFLINQGSIKSGLVLAFLRKLEKFVYDHSDSVITIDEIFYNTIVQRFKNKENLVVIPNFVDTDIYRPGCFEIGLLDTELFPVTKNIKLMYAGNIGYAQDWDPLIQMAVILKDEPVEFWIIGEGVLKNELQQMILTLNLTNIHMIAYQPRQNMAAIIGYADAHFIFMNPQMEGQGFPSKVYTIMACKKPLIVLSGEGTPLYNFLKDKNCSFLIGKGVKEDNYSQLEKIIRSLIVDKGNLLDLGENGYNIIHKKYTKKVVINEYIKLVDLLLYD